VKRNTEIKSQKPEIVRLLSFLTPFMGWIALAVLLGAVTVGSGIGLMAASAWIIATAGSAALHTSIADLQVAIVGVRFFGIARGVFRYLERYISHQVTFRVLARLRVWFYAAIEPLAPARLMLASLRSGDLLARIVADIETLQNLYVRVIAPPVVAALVGMLMCVFLFAFDRTLALAFAIVFVVTGAGVPLVTRLLSRASGRRLVAARAELNAALVDGIQGAAELVAFGQEAAWLERIKLPADDLTRAQARMASIGGLQSGLCHLLTSLAVLAVLVTAIPLVGSSRIAGVNLALLALAVMASFEAVLPLPLAAQYLASSLEAARRLFEIATADDVQGALDLRPRTAVGGLESVATGQPDLAIKNLRFRYTLNDPLALDALSLDVPHGKRIAVVGPSGAGKSTLVNVLLRFWDYVDGAIRLGGRELRECDPDEVRRLMGVVSQSTYLFNATIRDNLLIARPEATCDQLNEAVRRARLDTFVQSLPQGYDTWIGEQGLRLSGGERQRLAIARALLKDAPILILDEATANLDAVTEREVIASIRELMQGRTTLIITHRLVGLDDVDEILVLQSGCVVARGRHHELLQVSDLYRRMWKLQNQVLAT
jgi:ATP-binding cassette subfamily C protein CydC